MSLCSEAGFSSEEVLSLRFPLHRACRDGDLHCLTSLLQGPPGHTALQLGKEDSCYGWTPIHWAAHFGKLECLIQLVRAGCSVNACTTSFAQTPAHIAAFGGHPHCLLWLLQAGAYINKQDYVGETPVHKAARAGSMDCLKALVSNGAQIDFRNASDLTAADLAHSQGFRECAQFLLNLQNRHLNGLYLGGSISGAPPNIPSSHFNGGNNRKRSFNELEISAVKKPRTEVNGFGAVHPQSVPGYAEEENMHVENHSVELSDLNGSSPFSILTNGHAINKSTAQLGEMEMSPTKCLASPKGFTNGTMTNGKMEHEHGDATENQAGAVNTLCGSFNVSGSPTEWVAHSPSWGDGVSDCLLYGHYHGFGDTAESLPELSSMVEHSNSVKVEYKYNSTFISTLHQYQGF